MDIAVSFTEPDLVFIASDETVNNVADDDWNPERLSRRDRAILLALLELATEKLEALG